MTGLGSETSRDLVAVQGKELSKDLLVSILESLSINGGRISAGHLAARGPRL
jgi:hypothetical protein